MNWKHLLVLAALAATSAEAQQARVVTTCGSVAPFGSQPAGGQAYATMDQNGNLCTNATSGGGGGGGVVQQGAVDATGGVWVFDTGSSGNLINAVKGAIPPGGATIGATLAMGSAAINSNVIAVGTTSTLIAAARTGVPGTGRASITIVNTAQAVSLCVGNTGVTTANGMCLPAIAGASITLNTTAAVYGVWGDAGTHNVSFIETF